MSDNLPATGASRAAWKPAGRGPWKWLLRVFIGAAIVALLLSRRDAAAQVAQTLRAVPFWVVLGAVAFYWAGQILSAWKWQLLLRARGTQVSLARCCRIYAAGMFGNLWLPTNVGGDALRATLLAKRAPGLGRADALASIAVERLTGFVALLFIAAVALLLRGFSDELAQFKAGERWQLRARFSSAWEFCGQ